MALMALLAWALHKRDRIGASIHALVWHLVSLDRGIKAPAKCMGRLAVFDHHMAYAAVIF